MKKEVERFLYVKGIYENNIKNDISLLDNAPNYLPSCVRYRKVIPMSIPSLCPRKTLWNYATEYCYGQNRRWMCNLGFRDLNQIYSSHQPSCLFINKFDLNVDSRSVLCLREHFTKFY